MNSDALVVTGNYAGLKFPMVGGIDLTGTVVSDESGAFNAGDEIVLNSFGIGTDHWGGYAEQARVRPEWCLKIPSGMDHLSCARIGTAGYTAALCVEALVANGVKPEDGKIIVSGATGGVGSVAVAMLSNMGYSVNDLNITFFILLTYCRLLPCQEKLKMNSWNLLVPVKL